MTEERPMLEVIAVDVRELAFARNLPTPLDNFLHLALSGKDQRTAISNANAELVKRKLNDDLRLSYNRM